MLAYNKNDKKPTMKNEHRSAAFGRQHDITWGVGGGGLSLICGRPTLALGSWLVLVFCMRRRFLVHQCIILET